MEKLDRLSFKDRIFTFMIIITLLMIIAHLYTQFFNQQNINNTNEDSQLQMQQTNPAIERTDSIWKNTEFMSE